MVRPARACARAGGADREHEPAPRRDADTGDVDLNEKLVEWENFYNTNAHTEHSKAKHPTKHFARGSDELHCHSPVRSKAECAAGDIVTNNQANCMVVDATTTAAFTYDLLGTLSLG